MSGIPDDILKSAEDALDNILCNCVESCGGSVGLRAASITEIASAILAERKRGVKACASISSKSREEAELKAKESLYQAANHWNAHADGCDECIAALELRENAL